MVVGDILSTHLSNHSLDWPSIGSFRAQSLIDFALTIFKLGGKTGYLPGHPVFSNPDDMPDESFLRQALAQWSLVFGRIVSHGKTVEMQQAEPAFFLSCLFLLSSSLKHSCSFLGC
jgi:hypothetical protein